MESKVENLEKGELFGANLPFTTVQKLNVEDLQGVPFWKLGNLPSPGGDNLHLGLGILGMPGSAAYAGLVDILRPKENETIFVSSSCGAVGSMVGMLAKNVFNCKVIGSCGSEEKCKLCNESFGYDHVINYKEFSNAEELSSAIKNFSPEGIDMYFDNVGGMHWYAALDLLKPGGRVALCGQISSYSTSEPTRVSLDPMKFIYQSQRVEGFLCFPWLKGEKGRFMEDMSRWVQEGKICEHESFYDGLDQWPCAFRSLFTGDSIGKVVVRNL
jgi:NADPH-dependent curcumin reductase CurA